MSYDLDAAMKHIREGIDKGPYKDTWESLSEYQVPDWYKNVKFGIFIHWGVFSVPAFDNEWYPRNMYIRGEKAYEHHIATYGPHKNFGYKDFVPMFKAEKFDPDQWMSLFKEAGAQYVIPVAEHHDGFQMYKSEISHWNAAEMGPMRDVLGELKESAGKQDLILGASSHRIEHWFFLGHGKQFDSDVVDVERGHIYWPSMPEPKDHFDSFSEPAPTDEFCQDWLARTVEIIDKYHPRVLYFDWWIHHSALRPYLKMLAAYYYNAMEAIGEKGIINYKEESFLFGTAVPDVERGQFAQTKPYIWQTDTAICFNSWCHTEQNRYKKAPDILCDLVDVVSKNGRMLLNVGPKKDGTITDEETAVLKEIGAWLKVNGEAIYSSHVYKINQEGPTEVKEGGFADGNVKVFTSEDFRFTRANDHLYAICLKKSETGDYLIKTLSKKTGSHTTGFSGIIKSVSVLGGDANLAFTQDEEGLHLHTAYGDDKPITFKIELM